MSRGLHLTNRQANVVFVVSEHGPVTASDVAKHLRMTDDAARASLARLEARALVDAHYTGLRAGHGGRGWTITDAGSAALAASDYEDDDEEGDDDDA